mmetsp:Transcript_2412/g.6971  ORF Transcript_2412/g.6971 Transcript_2412/m.6971 type:complete len:208 (-) Transcript_2412:181-804(-)
MAVQSSVGTLLGMQELVILCEFQNSIAVRICEPELLLHFMGVMPVSYVELQIIIVRRCFVWRRRHEEIWMVMLGEVLMQRNPAIFIDVRGVEQPCTPAQACIEAILQLPGVQLFKDQHVVSVNINHWKHLDDSCRDVEAAPELFLLLLVKKLLLISQILQVRICFMGSYQRIEIRTLVLGVGLDLPMLCGEAGGQSAVSSGLCVMGG